MLVHIFFMGVVDFSFPHKLIPIMMVLSATLIYDSALLIDLIRNNLPQAYSFLEVLGLGIAPWLIAGILSVRAFNNTTEALKGVIKGVLLSVFVLIYTWIVLGGFSLTGLLMSMQFFMGIGVSMVLASIGAICGLQLNPWVQRIFSKRK